MTRVDRVAVEGFRGIESLAVEPAAVTVVTGRNGTGKTALLDAVELALDPSVVHRYGPHAGALVHADADRARVAVESGDEEFELLVRRPSAERAREALADAVFAVESELLDRQQERLGDDADRAEGDTDRADAAAAVREELRTLVGGNLTGDLAGDATGDVVLLDRDGDTYPYVFPSDSVWAAVDEIHDRVQETVYQRAGVDADDDDEPRFEPGLQLPDPKTVDESQLAFPGGTPPATGAVARLDVADRISRPPVGGADDDTLDEMAELLAEADHLDDFSGVDGDELVFERDGESYAVPHELAGEGARAVVGMLVNLLDGGDVALLEEPATHLHPGTARELGSLIVEVARERDVQLVLTTHDRGFVEGLYGEHLSDDEREFLEEEFALVQMEGDGADVLDYEAAEGDLPGF